MKNCGKSLAYAYLTQNLEHGKCQTQYQLLPVLLLRLHGWTESTSSSDKLSREWTSSKKLSHMGSSQARSLPRLLLPTAVNFKSNNNHFKRDLSITYIFYFPTFFCENIVIVLTFKVAFPSPASPQRSLTSYFFTLSNNLTFFVANLHHFFP